MRRARYIFILLTLGLIAPPVAASPVPDGAAPIVAPRREQAKPLEEMVEQMTLRQKIGQLVMFSVAGTGLSDPERAAIHDRHLGGVILFARNYQNRTQLKTLNASIQKVVRRGSRHRIGALISVDQEGGVVKRFPDMPPGRSAPEMGDIGSKDVAFDEGRATGKALSRHGVNVNLAPVADLDLPPEHVMRSRSFGSERYAAGRLVKAFGEGMQRKRVAATAKHFPGLGGATINTDEGRGYVYRSKWQLRNVDSVPFHKAIKGHFRLMMLSHAMYVNDGGEVPASVSRHIATRRLRKEFGFTGVAISDDLGAVAWRFGGNVAKACRATVKAGVDIALLAGGASTAVACADRIYRAVRRNALSLRRIEQAVLRVLKLKRWTGVIDVG